MLRIPMGIYVVFCPILRHLIVIWDYGSIIRASNGLAAERDSKITKITAVPHHLPLTFLPELVTCRLQSSQYHLTVKKSQSVSEHAGERGEYLRTWTLTVLGRRTPQTNTLEMEPFNLAFLAVASDHLTKRHPVTVAVSGLIRIIAIHLIVLHIASVLVCFLLLR